ncbi:MAG: hypothetical protein JNN06_17470 [Gemmobacter sp.]|uniref:hypothetical protein n=1 Tax=Gemmobacter sp. TaxID=1898957 RepID=UPI001A531327|nr:hypothetical protein [Gemmobacter sp.]MBL8564059.1 hypothetical protein [Gemmobacter sp.]
MRPRLPTCLLACLFALPAHAETPPQAPGPVERLVLAYRLAAAGMDQRDGLAQITAARLAGATTLQALDLKPEVEGKGKAEATPLPDAAALLAQAQKAVEADETLGILLAGSEASLAQLPKASLRGQAGALAPGQTHRYRLPVDGGAAVELGVIASGVVLLEVATESGILCKGAELCRVTLPESGYLAVTLTSAEGAGYQLLTN